MKKKTSLWKMTILILMTASAVLSFAFVLNINKLLSDEMKNVYGES